MKKRLLASVLAVMLAASSFTAAMAAESGTQDVSAQLYNEAAPYEESVGSENETKAMPLDGGEIAEPQKSLAVPEITNIIAIKKDAFKVNWNRLEGAYGYRLFVKNGSGWKAVGDTRELTLTHTGIKNNISYTYTVRAIDKDGNYAGSYNSDGWSATNLSVPAVSSVKPLVEGVKVSWSKVQGAQSYRVFRKSGSNWQEIAFTNSTAITDKAVSSGKTYTYTVRCITTDQKSYTSYFDEKGKSLMFVSAPTVTRIDNVANGAQITWNKVAGAASYRVFVKTSGSDWSRVGVSSSNTLVHTTAKGNTTYTYAVRALDKNGEYASDYYSQGWSNKYLVSPALVSAECDYNAINVNWSKVAGAQKYRVFLKSGSEWKHLGETTSTSFRYTGVKNGQSYTFTVRCISNDLSKYTSYYNSKGITAVFRTPPFISKIQNLTDSVSISWNKVSGAAKYRIYYKTSAGWTNLKTTADTSYSDTSVKNRESRTYTVRALDSSSNFITGYYSLGWTNRFLAPPALPSVSGNTVKWTAESYAAKYRIYRKTFGGSWVTVFDMTSTSFTDANAPKNVPYTYTIRYLDSNGSLASYYIDSDVYYYNGSLANGKITVNGSSYTFQSGTVRQGLVTINGSKYFYSTDGVLQKNGIVGSSKDGYYYADSTGKIDFSFTGISKNSKGYWYCYKGRVDFSYRNAVTYGGYDWVVLDGKATRVSTDKDRTLFRAFKLLNKITDSSMSDAKKLRVCFDHFKVYAEGNPRIPHYTGMDWPELYANDVFVNSKGNCLSYAAAFGYLAKAIGYTNIYGCHSGGHGWCEINGKVYDPEWAIHRSGYSYFGMSYNEPCDVNYKAGIAPGYAWMHVKI